MIRSKKTETLAVVLLVLSLLICWLLPRFAQAAGGVPQQYESRLFGVDLITLDIQMDADDWAAMLDNAVSEDYYACDVTINGETFRNVGIRPKGNTSLSQVAASDSDRYSFKLEFDHYQDGQTCWGLDKLVLNNLMADATYIKEYIVYDMFAYLDVPSSLYGMAQITVNGENWGVYLALEGVEESFLSRNFGAGAGDLYKPENMGGGGPGGMMGKETDDVRRMMGQDTDDGQLPDPPDDTQARSQDDPSAFDGGQPPDVSDGAQAHDQDDLPALNGMQPLDPPDDAQAHNQDDAAQPRERPAAGGGPGMAGGGSDLVYTDDALDSYETIWDGAVTDTDDSDHARVVEALRKISSGDLDGLDVDLMARYMAVQTFVVNLDSLSGSMAHNYYLYEDDGKLALLPWDYNLAFGGFQTGDASAMVNFPIDTPVLGVSLEDRPIFTAILNDPEACAAYHGYLRQLAEDYVGGGQFAVTYQLLRNLLDGRAGSDTAYDPTAFYTAAEYEAGITLFQTVVEKRAESILGQLDGTIPATTDGQQADSSALVDASGIDLTVLGTQEMGGGRGDPK